MAMVRFLRENLKVVLVAMVTAMLTASAPAIAHGVRHAMFAHNADKVDGVDSSAFQKKCKNGSVLAFARVDPSQLDADSLTSDGITEAYNCASPGNPAVAKKGSMEGFSHIRFPGLMSGYDPDTRNYVVSGNVEGGARTISFQRTSVDTQPVMEVAIWNTFAEVFEDNYYTVTLFKVGQ
jgi:hypothetical protein